MNDTNSNTPLFGSNEAEIYGQSYFTKMSPTRSCGDIGIPIGYCLCPLNDKDFVETIPDNFFLDTKRILIERELEEIKRLEFLRLHKEKAEWKAEPVVNQYIGTFDEINKLFLKKDSKSLLPRVPKFNKYY